MNIGQQGADPVPWQVAGFRITAFPRQPSIVESTTAMSWWQSAVGQSHDTYSSKKSGEQVLEGDQLEGKLELAIMPIRIDWRYSVKDEQVVPETPFPILGAFEERLVLFKQMMARWLQTSPTLARLAFGCVLINPVKDLAEGNSVISSFLPFNINGDNSHDFLYQINRRRMSGNIPKLAINRLSKWLVLRAQSSQWENPQQIHQLPDKYACVLELDINTVREYVDDLDSNVVSNVFDELVELGVEISVRGDIP